MTPLMSQPMSPSVLPCVKPPAIYLLDTIPGESTEVVVLNRKKRKPSTVKNKSHPNATTVQTQALREQVTPGLTLTASTAPMEGAGKYNAFAQVQAAGIASAQPILIGAAQRADLPPHGVTVVIADYGSSEGKNSLSPMRNVIQALRARVTPEVAISVTHTDLPANDFRGLFSLLDSSCESYLREQQNIFCTATGRSFYEKLFPANSVTLGWCSFAAHWLSRVPVSIPGHIITSKAGGEAAVELKRQAATDWSTFLAHRTNELRPGGRLVVVLTVRDDNGVAGTDEMLCMINSVLQDLVALNVVREDEYARMMVPDYTRNLGELLAPFSSALCQQDLTLHQHQIVEIDDPVWNSFQLDRNPDTLLNSYVGLARAVWFPALLAVLDLDRSTIERSAIADLLESRLRQQITAWGSDSPVFRVKEIIMEIVKNN